MEFNLLHARKVERMEPALNLLDDPAFRQLYPNSNDCKNINVSYSYLVFTVLSIEHLLFNLVALI